MYYKWLNSTTTTTSTSTTTPIPPTTTLRPKRTTSPLPTSPNPLLRFYPPDEFDKDDPLEEQFMDDMINDAALYHDEDGTNKRDAGIMSPWASKSSITRYPSLHVGFIAVSITMTFRLIRFHNFFLNTRWIYKEICFWVT